MTQLEAISAIDLMIQSRPDSLKESEDFGLLVSKEIARHLVDYSNSMSLFNNRPPMQSGDEFKWRGVNCRVA